MVSSTSILLLSIIFPNLIRADGSPIDISISPKGTVRENTTVTVNCKCKTAASEILLSLGDGRKRLKVSDGNRLRQWDGIGWQELSICGSCACDTFLEMKKICTQRHYMLVTFIASKKFDGRIKCSVKTSYDSANNVPSQKFFKEAKLKVCDESCVLAKWKTIILPIICIIPFAMTLVLIIYFCHHRKVTKRMSGIEASSRRKDENSFLQFQEQSKKETETDDRGLTGHYAVVDIVNIAEPETKPPTLTVPYAEVLVIPATAVEEQIYETVNCSFR